MPRILVVDDDPQVLRVITRLIGKVYETEGVRDGLKALDVLRSGPPPDLVLSDVDMPGMDGVRLYKTIVREGFLKKEALMFMSGRHHGERVSFLLGGGILVMRKPFTNEFLMDTINERLSSMGLTEMSKMAKIVA